MKKKFTKNFSIVYLILGIVLFLYTIFLLGVVFWGVSNSLKTSLDFRKDKVGFPSSLEFENYVTAFSSIKIKDRITAETYNIFDMLLNTLLYVGLGALITVLIQCIVSYLCVVFPCKFSKFIYAIVIATMAIPLIGTDSSTIVVLNKFSLYNTMIGALFMKSYFIGMYFLVFYSSFKLLPKSYCEAAAIDGAGNFTVLFKIMMPLVRNIFFTIFLLNFIALWNDYNTPLLYIPSYPTLAYGVFEFTGGSGTGTSTIPMKLSGCMILLLPILVLFLAFNKRLLEGVSMGGIKE